MDSPHLVRPGTISATALGNLDDVPGIPKSYRPTAALLATIKGPTPLTKADLPTYKGIDNNINNINTITSPSSASLSSLKPTKSKLTFDTSIIYHSNMLQRPLIIPVQPSNTLEKYQTKDLLNSYTERIQHATVSGRLQSPQAAGIANNLVNWQNNSRQVLTNAKLSQKYDEKCNDLIILGQNTLPSSSTTTTTNVQEKYATARDRELAEQREAADLASTLRTWRAQRKLQNEAIERNIQLRRRPRSANLNVRVDYRAGVREVLNRPNTVGSNPASSTTVPSLVRKDTITSPNNKVINNNLVIHPPVLTPNDNNNNNSNSISMSIGNKALTLDFIPSTTTLDNDTLNAIHDAIGLPNLDSSRPGTSSSNPSGSRPNSSRPGSRGILSMISLHGMESTTPVNTNIPGIDPQHSVKLTSRLNIPIIVNKPASIPIGTPKGTHHRNRPSMVGWWNTEGRNQAKEREEQNNKNNEDNNNTETNTKLANVPMGPAGVPLLPEASIEPIPDILNSMQQLRTQIDAEDDYDVDATLQAFEKKGITLPTLAVSQAIKTSTLPTSMISKAQQERPVTASSGFFGLGENPVAREKRLAALKNQVLAAAKKAGGGKGKKK